MGQCTGQSWVSCGCDSFTACICLNLESEHCWNNKCPSFRILCDVSVPDEKWLNYSNPSPQQAPLRCLTMPTIHQSTYLYSWSLMQNKIHPFFLQVHPAWAFQGIKKSTAWSCTCALGFCWACAQTFGFAEVLNTSLLPHSWRLWFGKEFSKTSTEVHA